MPDTTQLRHARTQPDQLFLAYLVVLGLCRAPHYAELANDLA